MNKSDTIAELAKALSKAQGEMPNIAKNAKAYNYKYADLAEINDVIKEPMKRNGLSLIHQMCWGECSKLVCTLLHDSGEWINTEVKLAYKPDGKVNEMQAIGSAITYARRYAICCLLNLAADADLDDDGEKSAPKGQPIPVKKETVAKEYVASGKKIGKDQILQIDAALANKTPQTKSAMLKWQGVSSVEEIEEYQFEAVMRSLTGK